MSFVTVKYGENREQIFNANCQNKVLLEYIKDKCDCDQDETIELCDENGRVKQLQRSPTDYAVRSCRNRETLVLLQVTASEEDQALMIYKPKLTGMKFNSDFYANLNPKPTAAKGRRRAPNAVQDKTPAKDKTNPVKGKTSARAKAK